MKMKKKKSFKKLIKEKEAVVLPGTFNALVAKQIEAKGFNAVYCTGAGISTSFFGLPDIGLMTLSEMITVVRNICNAVELPVICDADTGFGNAINVMRTVEEYERAGVAGLHIEDQVFPKRCGHVAGKNVISKEEMVGKIKAALAARTNPEFVIIARIDARSVEGIESAIERGRLYRDAGADIVFPEALETEEEFIYFAESVCNVPLMANMTEFGKTPYFGVEKFKQMGYKIIVFPVSTMRVAMKATENFLTVLKKDGTQKSYLDRMQTRRELYQLINYSYYTSSEKKYLSEGGVNPL